jgi:hypothetical protein
MRLLALAIIIKLKIPGTLKEKTAFIAMITTLVVEILLTKESIVARAGGFQKLRSQRWDLYTPAKQYLLSHLYQLPLLVLHTINIF